MLDNKRRIPLGYSNSLARDQENRPLDGYHRDRKQKNGEKKSYSISYEVPKDDPAQNSPHFLNAITSSRTDREVTELQTSLRETRVELERKAAKVENEITMRREIRKMKESMQYEQQKKLKELEESVNEYWTAKITKLHRDCQGQLSELEKSGEQNIRTSPPRKRSISELAKKIEEKHYREYVHKVDEIKQNFKKIDDENKMEIKKEIIKELEPIYKEQLSQSRVQHSSQTEENQQNIERETRSSNRVNRLKLRTQESLERSLVNKSRATQSNQSETMMTKEAEKLEEQLRREYQEDLHVIKKVHENDEKEMWKVFSKAEMRTRDKKRQEIEEKLNKELALKEKSMELKFRQKMEAQQEAMKRNFELEVENQLKEEKKSLLEEKGEIGRLKSRANIKAHKVEEAKQEFYKKLKEQEEKFAKKVDNLQRELDGLKQGPDERDESPSLGQLRAEYLRKQQDQGEAALTTEKWKKSLRDQGKENRSKSPVTSKSFVGLKPPLSDSINERARSSQVRRKSYVAPEDIKGNKSGYSSQSTARENTSRMETSKEYQNPKYYLQKSVRGEQESSSPFNRSFNSKLSNIAVVAAKKDDSNRTMKAVLDAAQPPELLFSSKVDTVPLLPYRPKEDKYNRKPSGDTRDNMTTETLPSSYDITTRRRSLIKNESSVEYGKLKAEIMSKYEPGQNRLRTADMSFMDGMAKSRQDSSQGKKTPDNALEKAKLAEQRKKEFTDKYNKSLKKMEFERSAKKKENERQYTGYTETGTSLENSRLLTLNPEEKYREIMEKYLDKSVAQKYEVTEKMKRSSGYAEIGGKYQELFRINEDENAQTKSMKRFKKVIEAAIEKDNALEAKYLAREVFFTTDFITSLDSDNKYLKETLKGKFRHLFEGWNVTETSYEARLKFLGELDLMLNLENVIRKVDAEIEYLSQYSYEIGEIIGLLKQRNKLKGKVNVKKFEYSLYKGVYGMIDEVLGEMKVLLQDYHRLRKREVIYKGIDLSDIIKVDTWEHAYLDEVEEREVLWERVKHRH